MGEKADMGSWSVVFEGVWGNADCSIALIGDFCPIFFETWLGTCEVKLLMYAQWCWCAG